MGASQRNRKFKTFVLMPHGSNHEYKGGVTEANQIFHEIIEPAVEEVLPEHSGEIEREVDRNTSGLIINRIVENIVRADVVIVDITGRNPNVFLELGIRYALRKKTTILIKQNRTKGKKGTKVPFDISGYRYVEYDLSNCDVAIRKIAKFIREGLKADARSDSIVFDVFNNMAVTIPGIIDDHRLEGLVRVRQRLPEAEFCKQIGRSHKVTILNTWIPNLERDLYTEAFLQALKRKTHFQILLLRPGDIADLRNTALRISDSSPPTTSHDVRLGFERNMETLQQVIRQLPKENREYLQIKIYHSLPSISVYRAGDRIFAGIFFHGRLAIDSPQFEIEGLDSLLGKYIMREVDTLWKIGRDLHDVKNWRTTIRTFV